MGGEGWGMSTGVEKVGGEGGLHVQCYSAMDQEAWTKRPE